MTHLRKEIIGNATLYLSDAREVVPTLGKIDAIISDPPYGQRLKTNVAVTFDPAAGRTMNGRRNIPRSAYPAGIIGDDVAFDPTWLLDAADTVLLWGAHKFHDRLPGGRWLVWDKVPNGKLRDQGCGEAAWMNSDGVMRIFRHLWDGLSIAGGYETQVERSGAAAVPRSHPTQKPVDLMTWCIAQCGRRDGATIVDPYMGSGSTGIAAVRAGHPFVGVELEPQYFDAACRRIERAQSQPDMFGAAA